MDKMSRDDINKELIDITNQLLIESGTPYKHEINLNSSLQRHLGIDSLGRAELFQRIEKFFDVNVPDRLLASADTLNDIANYLVEATPGLKAIFKPLTKTVKQAPIKLDPDAEDSLTEVVKLYGEKAPKQVHIYFQNEDGQEEPITYGELYQRSLRVAQGLKNQGLKEGETVAIMLPTTPGFFYVFIGVMFAGGVPVPIYPPFRMHMLEAYAKTESHILRNAGVRILVTFPEAEQLSLLLQSFVPSLRKITSVADLLASEPLEQPANLNSDSFGFIQYTSGSTSNPKGVLLTHANLLANIRAYGKAIEVKPTDVAVSWLPLYHDLGLIGLWLGSLYYGVPLVLLAPFTFLNHPERWFWAIHYHRGTVSGAPNFAYELCLRKIDPAALEGLDLSSWRLAANGAEKVYPRTLDEFSKKFAKFGFKREAFMPVYGLAESTVGLAVPKPGTGYKIDKVDRKEFEEHKKAIPSEAANALTFVGCGKPLADHEIRIVDEQNNLLEERSVGRVQFRGPSNMQGYFNNPQATAEIYHDGWLDSGDLGYLVEGEIYITGRRKDLIIKAGRNIYPAEIEELVGSVEGIRQGCVIAFASNNVKQGTEDLVIVAETREKNELKREKIENAVKEVVATTLDIVPDQIALVAPNTVPKTSSGKLQRAACKNMYEHGQLYKAKTPPWMQIVKLVLSGLGHKVMKAITIFGKAIYTFYVYIMVALTFLPTILLIFISNKKQAEKIIHYWAKIFLYLVFCPTRIIHKENLFVKKPVIYACNHASYADAIVALSFAPPGTRFVAKKEMFSMPFIGSIAKKLGYISVDRLDMPKGIEDSRQFKAALTQDDNIFIFPEGTFSYAEGLRPFRLGAFKIATETNTPVCPIGMIGTRKIFRGGEYLFRPSPITVTVSNLIMPTGGEWQDVTQLRDNTRAEIAKYCGEPTLDFIAAQTVAPKRHELNQ